MDEREERLAKNEAAFRAVNDQIEDLASGALVHTAEHPRYEFFCECSNLDCTLRLELTLAEYEHARADPSLFIVGAGHELPEIEEVVLRTDAYQIVRKHGEAAEIAAETDPRS
jgi:hypothetical protein